MTTHGARTTILLVGVGGQGVLTAAKILGDAANAAGHHVTVSQLHGLSQRGGSVECGVYIGPGKSAVGVRPADVLVAFEPLEGLRAQPAVGSETHVLLNLGRILPPSVLTESDAYPDPVDIAASLRDKAASVTTLDGARLVQDVGEPRTLNAIMLGGLAGLGMLPFEGDLLRETASRNLPARYQAQNRKAFDIGRDATARSHVHV
jgi:indolepyruvate ferredoxin oxidoreductase beta subunit